jgi:hypothetical protein
MDDSERSGRTEPVLNEPESETEAKTSPIDPVGDPSARHCWVCGGVLARRNQRVHAGPCARAHKTHLQKFRRHKRRW